MSRGDEVWTAQLSIEQQKIKHRCKCGKLIRGNPGWASHLAAAERRGEAAQHQFAGTN